MHTLLPALPWHAGLPTPTPTMTVNPENVTPGFIGFSVMALIAIIVVFLIVDMLRRIRRAGYRADVNEKLDAEEEAKAEKLAEEQARRAEYASDVDDQDIDPTDDPETGQPRG